MSLPSDRYSVPDDPGGQLLITRAGSAIVSTDALLASADRLRTLERVLHEHARRVHTADTIGGWPLDGSLVPQLERLRARCEGARDAFGRAAEEYTRTETALLGAQRDLAALLASTLGPAALSMLARLIVFAPGLLIAGALVGWSAIPDTGDGRLATVKQFLMDHPELITSPEFVQFVSALSTSIDAGTLGLLGVHPLVAAALQLGRDDGVATGALTVIALGSMLGMFRETPVQVEKTGSTPVYAAPNGARERLNEIPEGDQIRIERYEADGMPPRWVVYVGPTETFSPFATTEPLDSTSNVHGSRGCPAAPSSRSNKRCATQGSIRATRSSSRGSRRVAWSRRCSPVRATGMSTASRPTGRRPATSRSPTASTGSRRATATTSCPRSPDRRSTTR